VSIGGGRGKVVVVVVVVVVVMVVVVGEVPDKFRCRKRAAYVFGFTTHCHHRLAAKTQACVCPRPHYVGVAQGSRATRAHFRGLLLGVWGEGVAMAKVKQRVDNR